MCLEKICKLSSLDFQWGLQHNRYDIPLSILFLRFLTKTFKKDIKLKVYSNYLYSYSSK